ncbi:MAG: M20/M25/M40 family metallo-hydrolase, partial [Planctomycetota bacterium]
MQTTTSRYRRWVLTLAGGGLASAVFLGCAGPSGESTDQSLTTQPTTRPTTQASPTIEAGLDAAGSVAELVEQPPVPSHVDVAQIQADVEWLAANEREGRGLGTAGIDAAADYIAARFTKLGFESPGDLVDYRQTWSLNRGSRLVDGTANLTFNDEVLTLGEDYNPMGWSAAGTFDAPLAFAGYGIDDPETGLSDLDDVDLDGKVALVLRYEPRDENSFSRITGNRGVSGNSGFSTKADKLVAKGAKAIVIVNPPLNGAQEDRIPGFGSTRQISDVPVMFVTQEVAGRMLAAAGMPDLETMQIAADRKLFPDAGASTQPGTQPSTQPSTKPATRPNNAARPLTVAGGFESERIGVMATNVVGVLPGKNTDEYIVIGGHYDHIGMGEFGSRTGPGEIHNGADDNASGTAAVLAVAEMFASGPQPDCSIMFVLFSAEEIGLLGSRHIVQPENSPVPVDQLKAMINLDMVGRLRENNLSVGGMQNAAVCPAVVETANTSELALNIQRMSPQFDGRSDHASYNNAGIPAMF